MAALYEPPSTPEKSQRVFHQHIAAKFFSSLPVLRPVLARSAS